MRVLITGSQGFVGRAVVRALLERHPDYSLIGLDIRESPDHTVTGSKSAITLLTANVASIDEVKRAFLEAKPDVVVHTAGIVPQGSTRYNDHASKRVRDINVGGTANIIEASRTAGVQAIVYTSTCCVVTDDHSHEYPNFDETVLPPKDLLIYGRTKAEAERLVLNANGRSLLTCALRPSVILGEDDYQLIPSIHACISKGETPFVIGDGDNLYDFTYVGNVADAHVLAIENLMSSRSAAGQAFLISNGEPVTFRDFCLAVWGHFGHTPRFTSTLR